MGLDRMRTFTAIFALCVAIATMMSIAAPVSAQQLLRHESARDGVEIFVDGRGRRFIVDPYTGEVLGRANRNARFSRRDKYRAERAYRRTTRRARVEREFGSRFDRQERRLNRRRDRGFSERRRRDREFDERLDDREFEPRENRRSRQSRRNLNNEVASLPPQNEPVRTARSTLGMVKPKYGAEHLTKLQVFLDREGFSPGVIDGRWGSNVARAAVNWKQAKGSNVNLGSAIAVESLLARTGAPATTSYRITNADLAGPFVSSVPVDYARKAQLNALSYTSVKEMLAERFHMSRAHLERLNKGKNFNRVGTVITVVAPGAPVTRKVHYLIADKSQNQVRALDRNGSLVATYPATIGSAATPSPSGTHTVARIAINPEYTYNPKINFQQGNNTKILRIPPGPNGPVGSVWIALSKPTYGIHGTPNPSTIGKTNSHGCIRLTNWDAQELAKLVRKGVTVEFKE